MWTIVYVNGNDMSQLNRKASIDGICDWDVWDIASPIYAPSYEIQISENCKRIFRNKITALGEVKNIY